MVSKRDLVVFDGFFQDMTTAAVQAENSLKHPDASLSGLEEVVKCWVTYRVLASIWDKVQMNCLKEGPGQALQVDF